LPGIQVNYKTQLQIYAQKRGKDLPLYSRIQDGPSHVPRIKSVVTIDGKTFESPQYFQTVKEAESAAANLALMFLTQEASSQEQLPVGPVFCLWEIFLPWPHLFMITNLTIFTYFYK
jgi:hypothetical protein